MALLTIEQEWDKFAAKVFEGVPASVVQRAEMKRAFVAGAFVMLCAVNEIGEPQHSEDEGIAYLEARMEECKAFCRGMMREYVEKN